MRCIVWPIKNIFHKLTGRGGISSAIKLVISCNSCGFLCANSIISEIPVLLALDVFRVEVLALASLIPLALRLKNNVHFVISHLLRFDEFFQAPASSFVFMERGE